jgi:exonuclease VII small subunit
VSRDRSEASEDADGAEELIPVSELSYTEASRELDSIVEFFEHRDVDVDLLVAHLERATAIVDELDRRVRRTRSEVEQLVPRLQAATRVAAEEAEEDSYEEDEEDEEDEEG